MSTSVDEPFAESQADDAGGASIQDRVNRRVYHAAGVERAYTPFDELEVAEVAALLKYQPAICGRDVLDIGVGPGRTTPYLVQLARSYLGIDYSPIMIDCFMRKFPDVRVRCADMRDLSFLIDQSIDFALASSNVLDAVSHDDRLHVLRQLHRVLRPHGVVMFSSHNRSYEPAFGGPRLRSSRNPCTQALYVLRFFQQQFNHRRTGRLRRIERDYALLDDIGHDYRLLHYYIDHATQRQQLAACGFAMLDVYAVDGRIVPAHDPAAGSPRLYYLARKAAH